MSYYACPIMLSLHKPMPCDTMRICKLPKCKKIWCWQQAMYAVGRAKPHCTCYPMAVMKTDKRQFWPFCVLTIQIPMPKMVKWALVHAHPSKRKWCKHIATRQCLSYNSSVCTLDAFATLWHVRIVPSSLGTLLLHVMWFWLYVCNTMLTHQQGIWCITSMTVSLIQ